MDHSLRVLSFNTQVCPRLHSFFGGAGVFPRCAAAGRDVMVDTRGVGKNYFLKILDEDVSFCLQSRPMATFDG